MPRTGRVQAEVSATPEQVWAVLSDVPRIGEWSHECRTAQWLDGAREAAVGARFRGANQARFARWSKPCTITELEAPHRLVYRHLDRSSALRQDLVRLGAAARSG